jgi:hypothetical protein
MSASHSGPTPLPDKLHKAMVRTSRMLSAAIGFTWGPFVGYFVTSIWGLGSPLMRVSVIALTAGITLLGSLIPLSYFTIHGIERGGRVYVRLGVRWFKQWMMDGDRMNRFFRRRMPSYAVVRRDRSSLQAYYQRTITTERAHVIWLLAALPATGYACMVGHQGFAISLLVLNVITNLYPIWLQRYNRARLEHILDT